MAFSIDPNVKGAISESFEKSHLSDSFDVPAGCYTIDLLYKIKRLTRIPLMFAYISFTELHDHNDSFTDLFERNQSFVFSYFVLD